MREHVENYPSWMPAPGGVPSATVNSSAELPDRCFLAVDKRNAAYHQLQTAVFMWFNKWDPISIHTLAAAAHELMNALAALKGQSSEYKQWLDSLTHNERDRVRHCQNFFKHGLRDPKREAHLDTLDTDYLIYSSIELYEHAMNGKLPLVFKVWTVRFLFENPTLYPNMREALRQRGVEIEKLPNVNRMEFSEKVRPIIAALG